jgi:hypothetical protein
MATGSSAHSFAPANAVALANILLRQDLVLANTMNIDFAANFGGKQGATVDVRIPAALRARVRDVHSTAPITLDSLNDDTVPISLTDHAYSAVRLDDADLTLDIKDFGRQVLKPQTDSLREFIEESAVALLHQVPVNTTLRYDAAAPQRTFVTARKALRELGISSAGLTAAVGTGVYADLLNSGQLTDVDRSGSSAALRNGVIGRVANFDVVESNGLDEGEIVFYGRDSFALAVRAPIVPPSVFGASVASDGFALRWIRDYDSLTLAERSVVSTFVGGAVMPTRRYDATANGGTGGLVPVTPALRMSTTDAEPA